MNVSTVAMPTEVAKEKLKAVRKVLHRKADSEYEALEKAYSALGDGTPILDLRESIALGRFDGKGRPRLAIARADRRKVRVDRRREVGERVVFDSTKDAQGWSWSTWSHPTTMRVEVPVEDSPTCEPGWALVPLIPPEVREHNPASYDKERFILWEVEEWSDTPLGPQPPHDPMLLEPLVGDLYVVRAHWDLTELERMVMRGRETE